MPCVNIVIMDRYRYLGLYESAHTLLQVAAAFCSRGLVLLPCSTSFFAALLVFYRLLLFLFFFGVRVVRSSCFGLVLGWVGGSRVTSVQLTAVPSASVMTGGVGACCGTPEYPRPRPPRPVK